MPSRRRGQTVIETYAAGSNAGAFSGINFATLMPVGGKAEIVFAGQTGAGQAPQRFETNIKFRPNENHQVRIKGAIGRLGDVKIDGQERSLGQFSFQALDEWQTHDGRDPRSRIRLFALSRRGKRLFDLSPRLGLAIRYKLEDAFSQRLTRRRPKNERGRMPSNSKMPRLFSASRLRLRMSLSKTASRR